MVRCERCKGVFEERELDSRYSYDTGRYDVCPDCGGEDFEEVIRCENCGEWVSCEEADEGFCPDCAGKTLRLFREILADVFSEVQIDYLSHADCF